MAALSIVAASVRANSLSSRPKTVVAGAAITQGQPLYLNDNKYYPAANTAQANAAVKAIALTPAGAADQLISVLETNTQIFVGVAVSQGVQYYLGGTGEIVPVADLGSGDWITTIGIGGSNQNLKLNIFASGVQLP